MHHEAVHIIHIFEDVKEQENRDWVSHSTLPVTHCFSNNLTYHVHIAVYYREVVAHANLKATTRPGTNLVALELHYLVEVFDLSSEVSIYLFEKDKQVINLK